MKNYLLYSENFGFNTFFITDEMKDITRTKNAADIPADADFVIRWGTQQKIVNGPKIINKRAAILETCNKGTFRNKVAAAGHAPRTFLDVMAFNNSDVDYPVIVRPIGHSRSENLYYCVNNRELDRAIVDINGPYYISEFIAKTQELRVFCAQGRPFIVANKNHRNKDDISWGCVDEGTLDYVNWEDWPLEVVKTATDAFNISHLDFAAVDIMVKDGRGYFLECNTAPEVWKYYGQSFAKVFTYMINNDRERIPVKKWDSWKDCIHPAMSDKAAK